MDVLLAVLPGGSTALVLSGVMALVTIATGRSLLRDEAVGAEEVT